MIPTAIAFHPLNNLLLFPYVQGDGDMHLIDTSDLARLPKTEAYLREHEETLRGRERGKMDHDGWYGYVYPKNLGAHDLPKLGVPRLCDRLRTSADPDGSIYLDNVDVNGILIEEDGLSIWILATLLNSRLMDFIFRRGLVPFRGDFLSANKQFIAPLPVQIPSSSQSHELEKHGKRLHKSHIVIGKERKGFLDWLVDTIGQRLSNLSGRTKLADFDRHGTGELLVVLRKNSEKLRIDPGSRAFREELEREHTGSLDRLAELRSAVTADEAAADDAVYELYEVAPADRATIDAEYGV